MPSLTLASLRRHTPVRSRSAADQRLLDVAMTISRQGIRPAPVRRG